MAQRSLLLFTKTTGYRHDSLPDGIRLILESARDADIDVEHTEDDSAFTAENLDRFDGVVWLQVSGDVLTPDGRAALDGYLRGGGGWAGIHGASDAEWNWPQYESIVGARFLFHPLNDGNRQAATVIVDAADPATAAVPAGWVWEDEWYSFKRNPRGEFEILLRIDESTYDPQTEPMGADHPVSWRGRYGSGKTWYTSLGHYPDGYADPIFRAHIWDGIRSVLR